MPKEPDRYPTATKVAGPAATPQESILEYRGPVQQPLNLGVPRYLLPAAVVTWIAAGVLILFSIWLLLRGLFPHGEVMIPLGMMAFGGVVLLWEQAAVRRRSRACAICVGCAGLVLSVPLCLASAEALRHLSTRALVPLALAVPVVFATVAHFLWAAQLRQPRSRSWRV